MKASQRKTKKLNWNKLESYWSVFCMHAALQYHSKVSRQSARCESLFSTQFSISAQIKNQELRTSYRELRGLSLVTQKTKDSPMSDFSLITLVYLCKRLYAYYWNKTKLSECLKYKGQLFRSYLEVTTLYSLVPGQSSNKTCLLEWLGNSPVGVDEPLSCWATRYFTFLNF